MDGIYFFNGKDITLNMCIQIRDVIDIIQEKSHLSFPDATLAFYQSQTYKRYKIQTTHYGQSLPNILQTVIMKSRKQKNYKIHFDTNDNRAAQYWTALFYFAGYNPENDKFLFAIFSLKHSYSASFISNYCKNRTLSPLLGTK